MKATRKIIGIGGCACMVFLCGLLFSCNTNKNLEPGGDGDDGMEMENVSFQYSIIIKNSDNQDLLDSRPLTYSSVNAYPNDFVRIITHSQENVKRQSLTREKYENEYRLVIQVDCEKEIWSDRVEAILELCVALPGCGMDGIYTYDTIVCNIDKRNKSIVCNHIQVNGSLAWKNDMDNEVEPFLALTKESCKGQMICKPAEPIELTLKQGEKANADNRFAFQIFKEISAMKGDNTFFSPLSLQMALGMLYNGASGDTRTEMAEMLGLADFTETEINEYYQKISHALLSIDPLTDLGIANSIWYREGFAVKQPFIDTNKTFFDAAVQALDFSKSGAADVINRWCAVKTKDKITTIVENPIGNDVMMYLINALYFKSNWMSKFEKSKTLQDDFSKADDRTIKVNMMNLKAQFPYYADQHLQCVELPYGNGAFSMIVVLPENDTNIEQLIAYLDEATWENMVNHMYHFDVRLKLPRFKTECTFPLVAPLKRVGIQRIFDSNLAEFANISNVDLYVTDVIQKTFVEVNEEGTEAAAVTGIEVAATGSVPSVQFFANRPFLYLIKEKSTGMILFIGRMDDPT